MLIGTLGVLVVVVALWFGIPWIRFTLNTESTDDAFVNGHATFVAARVTGQVSQVLVDDNNRVHKGDVLVELDKEPFQDAVAVRKTAVDVAEADLRAAVAKVRGIEAQARSARWKLQHTMEDVADQISLLRARVAVVEKSQAQLTLAEVDFERAKQLLVSAATPRAEYDRRQAALSVARAQVTQSLADVYQIRVSLGLPAQPHGGADLGQVPPDLDQTFSSVLQAQAELIQSAAQLGVVHSYGQTPKQMIEEFEQSDPDGDINRTFARLRLRAHINRDRYTREIESIHGAEGPGRLGLTLERLFAGLNAIGLERKAALQIVEDICLMSTPPIRRHAFELLTTEPVKTRDIARGLRLPTITTRRALEDLEAHGLAARSRAKDDDGEEKKSGADLWAIDEEWGDWRAKWQSTQN